MIMISPKEKAEQLVGAMVNTMEITQDFCYDSTAKECSLILVNEILEQFPNGVNLYWEEVKTELKNL